MPVSLTCVIIICTFLEYLIRDVVDHMNRYITYIVIVNMVLANVDLALRNF